MAGPRDALELDVTDVAAGGDGIAHAPDGRVTFVRGAIPGDRVVVEITDERRTMLRGNTTAVVEPGSDRVEPPCPFVAEGCGGCGWQHVSVTGQRRLKIRLAEEALRRIGGETGTIEPGPDLPATGYRTTIRAAVLDGQLGFRAARSHDIVPVGPCLVAHPGLDALITDGRFGDATEVTLRIGATGERLVVIDPTRPVDLALPDDVVVIGLDELRAGRRASYTDVVHGRRFRVSAESFFQSRTDGAAALVDAVRAAGAGWWGSGRLVDLYGGVGLFGGCLGAGMSITLVEASRSSTADARHNLADLDADVVGVPVERWRPSRAEIVVADPPRAGLGRRGVEQVAATGADRVVLVSCDAAAWARDTRELVATGYRRSGTRLIDLFPHTPHVELVTSFERVGPVSIVIQDR